jgi:hypothetical protein
VIYAAILALCIGLAVLNRAARPFAFVMLAAWVATFAFERLGWFEDYAYIDGLAFSAMAILHVARPRWWSATLYILGALTMALHLWVYTLFFAADLWYGGEYANGLQALFLTQALVLILGGYDVEQRVAAFVSDLRSGHGVFAGSRRAFCRHSAPAAKVR